MDRLFPKTRDKCKMLWKQNNPDVKNYSTNSDLPVGGGGGCYNKLDYKQKQQQMEQHRWRAVCLLHRRTEQPHFSIVGPFLSFPVHNASISLTKVLSGEASIRHQKIETAIMLATEVGKQLWSDRQNDFLSKNSYSFRVSSSVMLSYSAKRLRCLCRHTCSVMWKTTSVVCGCYWRNISWFFDSHTCPFMTFRCNSWRYNIRYYNSLFHDHTAIPVQLRQPYQTDTIRGVTICT